MYKVYPFYKLVAKTNLALTPHIYILVLDNVAKFAEAIKEYTTLKEVDELTAGYYVGYSYAKKRDKTAGLLIFNKETVSPGIIAHEITHACVGILDEQNYSVKDIVRKNQLVIEDTSIEEVLAYMMDGTMEQVYKIIY